VSLAVHTTPEADRQILEIDEWWRANRRSAPDLFINELADAFELIANSPQIGRSYHQCSVPRTRRVLLKGARYHVYYTPRGADVIVLAVWHAMRSKGPPIRT
jgi:plasmid stabilization system protein ParE